MRQYHALVNAILDMGTRKPNRTGVDTISLFNYNYVHDLRRGFPLLTTKRVSWKNIVIENLWFLSAQPDISFLRKHDCRFWDPWADPKGNVPMAYGQLWRKFPLPGTPVSKSGDAYLVEAHNDQIAWVLDELKRNPMSRRLVVTPWAPGIAQTSALPPCHCMFILNVQNCYNSLPVGSTCQVDFAPGDYEILGASYNTYASVYRVKPVLGDGIARDINTQDIIEAGAPERVLNLHLTQRSCDVALGVPYNLAGYAFLLHLFARFSGLQVGTFAHTLVDAHIYTSKADGGQTEYDHIPGLKEQLTRAPRPLPQLVIDKSVSSLSDIEDILKSDLPTVDILKLFRLEGYDPHPAIKFKVAV